MIIYIVNQRLVKRAHFVDHVIMASPAGFHFKAPTSLRIIGRVIPIDLAVRMLNVIHIPSRFLRYVIFRKLIYDAKAMRGVNDLTNLLIQKVEVCNSSTLSLSLDTHT